MAATLDLSPKQLLALEAICDTFCPQGNGNGVAGVHELGVADAIAGAVALNPRAAERKQLQQLLGVWDTKALTAIAGGGFNRFSELPREERETVLLSWAHSRAPQRRAAFQALRKGSLLFYWALPGPGGARNPAWDAVGYPGPLGRLDEAPPNRCDLWRSHATRHSTAMSSSSARAPVAARWQACCRRQASTWSWWGRAATTTTRTSTARRSPL